MRMHFKGQSREREQKMWSLSFTPSFHSFCLMFLLRKKIGTGKQHLTRTGKGIRNWFKDFSEKIVKINREDLNICLFEVSLGLSTAFYYEIISSHDKRLQLVEVNA